jgi:hypothetical protein
LKQKILRNKSGGFFDVIGILLEILQQGVTIEPAAEQYCAATTQQNDNDCHDDHCCIVFLLRFFNDRGDLFVHDFYSLWIE